MNIGIIGTGLMSEIYSDVITQNNLGNIKAVVGNTPSKTIDFAERYNIDHYSNSDYASMFKNHKIDLVIIATPEWVREDPVRICVENEVHIILEKPFSDNIETARVLKKILAKHKKAFKLCHVLRYSQRFFAAKSYISSKNIIHIDSSRNSNIQRFNRISGKTDPAFWLAPHDIDMMIWLKQQKVKEVFSFSNLAPNSEALISTMLRFDDGTTGTFRNIWGTKPVSSKSRSAYFNIWHDDGCIEINDSEMNVSIYEENQTFQPDTYEDFFLGEKRMGFFKSMIELIFDDLKKDIYDTPTEIENAFHVTQVSSMISKSIKENRVIKYDEI